MIDLLELAYIKLKSRRRWKKIHLFDPHIKAEPGSPHSEKKIMDKNKKCAVIFDCESTLIKSLDIGMGSFNYAFERLGEGVREPDEIKKYFGAGADRIFLQLLRNEEKALRAFNFYLEHEAEMYRKFLHVEIH